MWKMKHRARGFRTTKCYPSVVCNISRHFAIGFFFLSNHPNPRCHLSPVVGRYLVVDTLRRVFSRGDGGDSGREGGGIL